MYNGAFRAFLLQHLSRDGCVVGHNFVSYDAWHLDRLGVVGVPLGNIVDTLVLSYLYNPHLPGGHSLEAYGEKLDLKKLGHTEWDHYSPEMLARCERDTELTLEVYLALCDRMNRVGFSELSCSIEHRIRQVVDKQQRNGFRFAYDRATDLCSKLRSELTDLAEPIQELFPPVLAPIKVYTFHRTEAGVPYASYQRHIRDHLIGGWTGEQETEGSTYTTYKYQPFDIASPQQRVEKLQSLGYKATMFTPGGKPKVDEDALRAFAETSGTPEVTAIADWLVRNSRLSMVEGWMKCYDPETGAIHGTVYTCGASTRRMRHQKPNTANIPKASPKVLYGTECRSLWRAREGRKLVGYDAAGLEMRGFGHYIGGGDAAALYISGDPHTVNTEALIAAGVPFDDGLDIKTIRNAYTKTIFYAFLYGAGDRKLGRIVTGRDDMALGALIRATLMKATPALARAVRAVQDELQASGGRIRTIDGGYVLCPSPHAALNYQIQSSGGIVMKLASILIDEEVTRLGLDSLKVGDIHDEGQHDVESSVCDDFGRLAVDCIRRAGEQLGFLVPLDGNYSIGDTWAETH